MGKIIQHPHTKSIEDVVESSVSDIENGLESHEVKIRTQKYGANVLETTKGVSPWEILFHNLNNIIVYLLIAAALVAFFMGDTVEAIAVIIAILIAVLSGFISEYKAQKSVESLQKLTKTISKVIRDGQIKEVPSSEIVVGDLLFIEEGDSITADARLVKNKNFASIESSLTGESEAVDKDHETTSEEDTPLGDRKNMIYSGTAATRGNAYAIVTSTGMETEIGKISAMLKNDKKEQTPLEKQLDKLGKTLIILSGFVAVVVTATGIVTGEDVSTMIKIGIILAIAAVPEALPAVSTITLAIGMKTMASHNALVKSLPAVETLGSTTVICTDKTGTLTENQMTVREIHLISGNAYKVEGTGYKPEGKIFENDIPVQMDDSSELKSLIRAGVLSSNASLSEDEEQFSIIGDPTEGGLVVLGKKVSMDRKSLDTEGYTRIGEIPFSSKEKFMVTAYEISGSKKRLYIKGAPDVLLNMSSDSKEHIESMEKTNNSLAEKGMRVLALGEVANYEGDGSEASMRKALENGISLLGLTGILDPPREDVKQAVKEAQDAGIRVIMITGDHPKTASIIASQIQMNNYDEVITGREMDKMSDSELAEKIKIVSVFARVSPENKLQIVRALNIDKEVTAMTGDGVNDAPALNGADIGIAMGIRGTEVAKDASDMILTDDRFSTIVKAIKEGRTIFDNIEKFVYFLFSCNVVEILAVFITILLRLPMPILALQILWLNLVVDVLPAMSLAWEPAEVDIMKRRPRNPEQAIVTKGFLFKVLGNGILISLGALFVFIYGLESGYTEETARTMAFSTMAFGQLFHIFNVRDKNSFGLNKSVFKNPYLIGALLISFALQIVAVYSPFLNRVMGTEPLNLYKWFIIIAGSVIPTLIIQIFRLVKNRKL
ncbi:MAG: HAD-IC family P-type ATPase [Clostridia bacterium]|nr:HAD-IC family P-type ATPase [Clostridia bacterium]